MSSSAFLRLFFDGWQMCSLTKFLGSFVFCDMWHGRCVPERFIRCAMDDVHSTPAWGFFTLNRRLLGFIKCYPELDLLAKLCEAEPRVLLKPVSWWSIQPAPWTFDDVYNVLLTFALVLQHWELILAATHFWIFCNALMYLLVLLIILLLGRYDSHNTLQRQFTKKFETTINRNETARPQSQFLHSCFCERFIYSHDRAEKWV